MEFWYLPRDYYIVHIGIIHFLHFFGNLKLTRSCYGRCWRWSIKAGMQAFGHKHAFVGARFLLAFFSDVRDLH